MTLYTFLESQEDMCEEEASFDLDWLPPTNQNAQTNLPPEPGFLFSFKSISFFLSLPLFSHLSFPQHFQQFRRMMIRIIKPMVTRSYRKILNLKRVRVLGMTFLNHRHIILKHRVLRYCAPSEFTCVVVYYV